MTMAGIRFDGTVTLGNLLTALSIAVGAFTYGVTIETRLTSLRDKDIEMEKRMDRADKTHTDAFTEIKGSLRRIEDKLDHKADKPK